MGWGQGLESQRGNLTSLLGALAQMKEGKKNRRSKLLSDVLGIGAGFGGALLQNKFAQTAATTADTRAQDAAKLGQTWREGEATTAFGRGKELQGIADTEAWKRLQSELSSQERVAGMRGKEGPDASKITPFDVASGEWDLWWERLASANPKRQLTAKDFDAFRATAAQKGAKYGFAKEQMEDAVNTLAQSYGFAVTPKVDTDVTPPPVPISTPRPSPQGLGEHVQAALGGIKKTGEFFYGEGKKAIAGIKQGFGGGITEAKVLDALTKAKQLISPAAQNDASKYEAEILQAGALSPERLNQIMKWLTTVVHPK